MLSASEGAEGNSPRHQFQLHSYLRLPRSFDLDAALYHASRLLVSQVPSYARLDVRFGWRLGERLEISAVGQNLLERRHLEITGNDVGVRSGYVQHNAYGEFTWKF